jgi:hypothetical protein
MYNYNILADKKNPSQISVSIDFLQGLYSMYNLASLYFMKPETDAKVLNKITKKFASVRFMRKDVTDTTIPVNYKDAYNFPLYRPSDFVHCSNSNFDKTLLPYHIVPNFDHYYVSEIISQQSSKDIFTKSCDDDVSRYYLGVKADARNVFLVKVVSSNNNIKDFLTGFSAGLMWYSQFLDEEVPDVYLYDYETPICLKPSYDKETMDKQLPKIATKVQVSK